MSPFEQLLKDLGSHLQMTLNVDQNQSCRLEFDKGPILQIDLDSQGDSALFGAELGKINPGVYRETIFRSALIANGMLGDIYKPIIAYSEKKNELFLFQYCPLNLPVNELTDFFHLFQNYAAFWHEAIGRGEIPDLRNLENIVQGRESFR